MELVARFSSNWQLVAAGCAGRWVPSHPSTGPVWHEGSCSPSFWRAGGRCGSLVVSVRARVLMEAQGDRAAWDLLVQGQSLGPGPGSVPSCLSLCSVTIQNRKIDPIRVCVPTSKQCVHLSCFVFFFNESTGWFKL